MGSHGATHIHEEKIVREEHFDDSEGEIEYDSYGRPIKKKRGLKDKIKGLLGRNKTHETHEEHYYSWKLKDFWQ